MNFEAILGQSRTVMDRHDTVFGSYVCPQPHSIVYYLQVHNTVHGSCVQISKKLAIKSAKIAHFSKSPGVLESSKSRLFESVKKK